MVAVICCIQVLYTGAPCKNKDLGSTRRSIDKTTWRQLQSTLLTKWVIDGNKQATCILYMSLMFYLACPPLPFLQHSDIVSTPRLDWGDNPKRVTSHLSLVALVHFGNISEGGDKLCTHLKSSNSLHHMTDPTSLFSLRVPSDSWLQPRCGFWNPNEITLLV